MQVTEIKVFPVEEEKLKAFVSIVIDGCFMVNDIKVIKGRDGLFISMPSRRKKNGKFKDVAHPLNNETRQMLERLILTDYERALRAKAGAEHDEPAPERSAPPPERSAPPPERSAPSAESMPLAAAPSEPAPEARSQKDSGEETSKSLEEVTEMHLRDSFWNS